MDREDIKLILIGLVLVSILSILIDWYSLHDFKKCYDINFQETRCQKYLKE
jgi:hypothetical protein